MKRIYALILVCFLITLSLLLINTSSDKITRTEAYYQVLSDIIENNVFPDGSSANVEYGNMSENKFAVCDVDEDGREELVVIFTTTAVAGMHARIYDYNEKSEGLLEQWQGSYTVKFFDNGYATTENHHNQTNSSLWPFYIHGYNPETDSYECIAWIHAMDRDLVDDKAYPHEIDISNQGTVYFIDEYGEQTEFTGDKPLDITQYRAWINRHIGEAKEIDVQYLPMTSENINFLKK